MVVSQEMNRPRNERHDFERKAAVTKKQNEPSGMTFLVYSRSLQFLILPSLTSSILIQPTAVVTPPRTISPKFASAQARITERETQQKNEILVGCDATAAAGQRGGLSEVGSTGVMRRKLVHNMSSVSHSNVSPACSRSA